MLRQLFDLFRRNFSSLQKTDWLGFAVIPRSRQLSFQQRQQIRASSSYYEDTVFADENKQYPKARNVNGRFVLPWSKSQLPSVLVGAKWFLISTNNSGLPRGRLRNFFQYDTKELDKVLPVLKPEKKTLDFPPANSIQVTWIGHATVLVQMEGINILTDPVFSDYCGAVRTFGVKLYRPVPCTVDELPDIDAVCISHNHYDHLDYNTVCDLNKRFGDKIHWFVPMGLCKWMKDCGCENVVELEWWNEQCHPKSTDKSKAVKFAFTPAQHWCRRGVNDLNKVLWGSWSIIGPQQRFFFAADSGYCHIFKQIGKRYGPFDVAAIPIGAYEPRGLMNFQHVNPQEAVKIHQDVNSNMSIGIHWGTFNLSYEHYLDPPKKLQETMNSKGIPHSKFCTIKHGEIKVITKEKEEKDYRTL